MDLRVGINLGTGGHRDLFLTIPALGVDVVADTYYFVLALQHSGVAVDAATVCQSIRNLLDQWCQAVSGCDGQSGVYLPFDFSDQSTGCLAVAKATTSACHMAIRFAKAGALIRSTRAQTFAGSTISDRIQIRGSTFRGQRCCRPFVTQGTL